MLDVVGCVCNAVGAALLGCDMLAKQARHILRAHSELNTASVCFEQWMLTVPQKCLYIHVVVLQRAVSASEVCWHCQQCSQGSLSESRLQAHQQDSLERAVVQSTQARSLLCSHQVSTGTLFPVWSPGHWVMG